MVWTRNSWSRMENVAKGPKGAEPESRRAEERDPEGLNAAWVRNKGKQREVCQRVQGRKDGVKQESLLRTYKQIR